MIVLEGMVFALRCIPACIVIYYGVAKLFASKISFESAIASYRLVPSKLVHTIAVLLPIVEVVLGLLLLFDVAATTIAIGMLLLIILFQGAIGSAMLRKLHIGCGCSGKGSRGMGSSPIYSFFRNFALMGLLLAFEVSQLRSWHEPYRMVSLEIVILGCALLCGFISASRSSKAVFMQSDTSQDVRGTRRTFLGRAGTIAVGLFALWFLNRQDVAFAYVPAPCDCNCLGEVDEVVDCGTYCPSGCNCPCSAPIFGIYYEVCCNSPSSICDTSAAIIGYSPCC